jgi:transposase InsO family protein
VLIRQMAHDNLTWGQERMANELCWTTFVRNHAQALVACDFCVTMTATFRLLYVFVVIEHTIRRLLHVNVTAHPTAQWPLQQLREAIPSDHGYRFLIHDRDAIFSRALDQSIRNLSLRVLKTPPRVPQANAICERVLGTLRQECLDFIIPLTDNHLRRILLEWITHYNAGRPHMALGPSIPKPRTMLPVHWQAHRHRLPDRVYVETRPILGGLHHEYWLAEEAA